MLHYRGTNSFEQKALNCQASGGVGAIIYNNDVGPFQGTLPDGTLVTIPVASVSDVVGASVLDNLNKTGSIQTSDGYTYVAGSTSIAAPHVTGAIAAIWRSCRGCANKDVVKCLRDTAIPLGAYGKDDEYGNGLIQAGSAYNCLKSLACC